MLHVSKVVRAEALRRGKLKSTFTMKSQLKNRLNRKRKSAIAELNLSWKSKEKTSAKNRPRKNTLIISGIKCHWIVVFAMLGFLNGKATKAETKKALVPMMKKRFLKAPNISVSILVSLLLCSLLAFLHAPILTQRRVRQTWPSWSVHIES